MYATGNRHQELQRILWDMTKANRYERTTDIILRNPSIAGRPHDLAKEAGVPVATAKYCIEAFIGTFASLLRAGLIETFNPVTVKND